MSEVAGFLAAIIAEPADDTVRLVYADWLDENSRPERAEFIRVQVELARLEANWDSGTRASRHRQRDAMRKRERELLRGPRPGRYEREVLWFNASAATLPCRDSFGPVWRRGFVECVTCTAADWLEHGDAIRAAHPVTRVVLTTRPDISSLAARWMARGEKRGVRGPLDSQWWCRVLAAEWPGVTFELPRGREGDSLLLPSRLPPPHE